MFEKQVTQSERRIRNSHVTSMRTGTPLGSNSNCLVYMLALESDRTPKAHDNRSELRKIRHRADSVMPRSCERFQTLFRAGAREGLGTRLTNPAMAGWSGGDKLPHTLMGRRRTRSVSVER